MTEIRIRLLDGFALECRGISVKASTSVRRLLTLLALSDRPVRRLTAAGNLWPDTSESRASANLRSTLWRVRQLSADLVSSARDSLRLHDGVVVDVHQATMTARRLLAQSTGAPVEVMDAEKLASDIFPGCYDEWVVVERERFRQTRLHALEVLCHRLTTDGRCGEAINVGLLVAQGQPLRESAQRVLIEAYLANGDVGDAVRRYQRYRVLLRDDLGVEPSPLMERLMSRIRPANRESSSAFALADAAQSNGRGHAVLGRERVP